MSETKPRRLTRKNAHRLALHYAIAERDSFASCQHKDDPEYRRAARLADEFRRVLMEEFGEKTVDDAFRDANHPSVSIFDLKENGVGPRLALSNPIGR